MTLTELLPRLSGVQKNGTGWKFKCPAHDDQHASATLTETPDRLLIHCFAGCSTADICGAWGINVKDLFFKAPTRNGNGTARHVAAEYPYFDESGVHLYDVLRYQPKDFRQRKADGTWNMNGVRRVLYRLPAVLKAEYVFVVEGEKSADALAAIGLTATCSPGGAGKWRPEYADFFKPHHHIVVLPDNDDVGRKHAIDVARSLHGKAASLKVVELPGLPPKGDVYDWLQGKDPDDAGEELSILSENAPQWNPGELLSQNSGEAKDTDSEMPFIGMRDLLNEPEEVTRWLVEDLLPMGGDSLCVAKPKVGKSTLARCLALSVARGENFLGRKTTKGTVFYLALEEKKAEVRRHFAVMGARDDDSIFVFCATSPIDGLELLREAMKHHKPTLVIVDPLFRFVRIKDGNDYNAVTNALEPLHALARETGAHVMALHHAGKANDRDGGDSVLGSTAIFASVDTLLLMKRHDKYRTISSIQRYGPDLEEITLAYNEDTRTMTAGAARAETDMAETMKAIVAFLQTQSEPVELRVIDDAVEGRKQMKWQAMKECLKLGTTNRTGNGKRGDPYLYSVSCSASSAYTAGTREQETVTPINEKSVSCSRISVQEREQEIPGNDKSDDDYRETLRHYQRLHEEGKLYS